MTRLEPPLDYEAVGLVCGLEVHQQLLTDRKLFCHCPAGRYTSSHDGTVLRHMRPTLSELGVYDGTALMEFKTRKHIVYLLNRANTCTYEMDDTPPFPVNQQAIDIAIEQCLMLGCDIVDEVHIARKQYLDGSIPTGFQRTAIVGVNGRLPFRGRTLSITQVSVEEDSCREVSDRGHLILWRTDRLGMPLIETVTGPDLREPGEVEEAILLIGRVCRSTGHVRVGLGASRQDVNVSVRGGRRVEIKGVPKAGWAPRLVHNEAVRQLNLLKLREALRARGFARAEDFSIAAADVTDAAAGGGIAFLRADSYAAWIESEGRRGGFEVGEGPFRVLGVRLAGLAGALSHPTQPGYTFAHEIAGRVRVIAGLDQPPILLHSEAWPMGEERLLARLRKACSCGDQDALIVLWGPERDLRTAVEEIRIRFADALDGVPNETRQPFCDGSTDFERILPGPDRMYPDTDSPPTRVNRGRVLRLSSSLPERPWEREARYAEAGIPSHVAHYLIRRNLAPLVDLVVARTGSGLRFAGFFFGERVKGLRRAGVAVERIAEARWVSLFAAFCDRPALADAWDRIVRALAASPDIDVEDALRDLGLLEAPRDWRRSLEERVAAAVARAGRRSRESALRFARGELARPLRGLIAAREVVRAVDEAAEVLP
ncbi:MAG: Glu-tRNA(Gln) amidotransferase subunit GatE [Planctomycetota bacterium]